MSLPAMLRIDQVERCVGLSRRRIYELIQEGSFPAPLKIGIAASGWPETEIRAWLASRPRLRSRSREVDAHSKCSDNLAK